ncbi:MAG TPA: hypothetical protein VN797_01255, partial [Gemmatimonadaceae bacterium]|nr:hypothetical protein [Gemmatimonadaceae bacterium]
MAHWTARAGSLLGKAGRELRRVGRSIGSALDTDPYELLAYYGYGNAQRAYVHGRVLEVRKVSASTDSDSSFRNLLNTYRRAEADPLPFARVTIEYEETCIAMTADDEGFFSGWIDLVEPVSGDGEWNEYKVSLVEPVHPEVKTPTVNG